MVVDSLQLEHAVLAGSFIVVADWSAQFRESLRRSFSGPKTQVVGCCDRPSLRSYLTNRRVDLLITELRLADGPTLDLIDLARRSDPALRIAVVTNHGSVATVVRCMRMGVDVYLTKPTTAEKILDSLSDSPKAAVDIPDQPMRLERAVWEYIHRAVESAGSITNAAGRLGLDRRSLRRMLAKYAPR
jgi:ActR/RegA family two-component response regulator